MAGATSGDGVASAKALCEAGMNVVVMTHNKEKAIKLMKEINNNGSIGKCEFFEGQKNEGPAEEQETVYRAIAEKYGSVDVVISNIGGAWNNKTIEEMDKNEFMKETQHLLGGAYGMVRAALPELKKSAHGRIILMSSVDGINGGNVEGLSYAVAKGAVASLGKNLAYRLMEYNITVNVIAKGAIKRVEAMKEGYVDVATLLDRIPVRRIGDDKDMAGLITFLASEESGYITGQVISLSDCWSGGIR